MIPTLDSILHIEGKSNVIKPLSVNECGLIQKRYVRPHWKEAQPLTLQMTAIAHHSSWRRQCPRECYPSSKVSYGRGRPSVLVASCRTCACASCNEVCYKIHMSMFNGSGRRVAVNFWILSLAVQYLKRHAMRSMLTQVHDHFRAVDPCFYTRMKTLPNNP